MGTWSVDAFGNDAAVDWVSGLDRARGLSAIERTLDVVLRGVKDCLGASDAATALAAIEILAMLQGHGLPGVACPARVDEWIARIDAKPSPALVNKAQKALARILGNGSELRELWDEQEDAQAWWLYVSALSERVAP